MIDADNVSKKQSTAWAVHSGDAKLPNAEACMHAATGCTNWSGAGTAQTRPEAEPRRCRKARESKDKTVWASAAGAPDRWRWLPFRLGWLWLRSSPRLVTPQPSGFAAAKCEAELPKRGTSMHARFRQAFHTAK